MASVAAAEPAAEPALAWLVLRNDSKVDIGFELTLDGKAVPRIFVGDARAKHHARAAGQASLVAIVLEGHTTETLR